MVSPCNHKRQADKSFVNLKAMGKKKFNITGTCYPHLHYMLDNRSKLDEIQAMVEEGAYFVINRPRQYGKTTLLSLLAERLYAASDYLPIEANFETHFFRRAPKIKHHAKQSLHTRSIR